MNSDPGTGGADPSPDRTAREPESTSASQSTVGTGSILGVGCLVAVVLLVLIALVYRWLGGTW